MLAPCVVVAGEVLIGAREMRTMGIEAAYAVRGTTGDAPSGGDVDAEELAATARRVGALLELVRTRSAARLPTALGPPGGRLYTGAGNSRAARPVVPAESAQTKRETNMTATDQTTPSGCPPWPTGSC